MKKTTMLLPLALVLAACTQSPAPGDPSVITSRSDAWDDALNAKDVEAISELYTSDARVLPPNRPMAQGRDAVKAEFGAMMDAGLTGELTSVETKVAGDVGFNVGTFVLRSGDDIVDRGKFIETWRRDSDGAWRISNDIYNSDAAMAANGEKTHLLITHKVADSEHWLAAWRGEDSRHKLFKENGAAHVHTFVNPEDPNLTGLVVSVEDMAALQAMLESDEGQAAAAEDGVDWESVTTLVEAQ